MTTTASTFPHRWTTELVRNASGRAFWFVSRFVSCNRLEYVEDVSGKPKCFRIQREAVRACADRNAAPSAT